jgi:hypothetical protein
MIKNVILFFFLPSNLHKENLKKKADVMMAPDVVEEVQQHIYSSDFFYISRWRANWKELLSDWNFIFLASSLKNLKNKNLLLYIVDVISCCSPLPSNAFSDIESRIYIFWCATGHYKSRRVFLKIHLNSAGACAPVVLTEFLIIYCRGM